MNLKIQLAYRALLIMVFISCFMAQSVVFAQVKYDVDYKFVKDTISPNPGETFSNTLLVYNHAEKKVTLFQSSRLAAGLLTLPDTMQLLPHQRRAFPVKYIADKGTITQRIQAFNMSLGCYDASIKILPVAGFATKVDNDNSLTMEMAEPQVYINQADNQANFTLECINSGLVPVLFKITTPNPTPGLEVLCSQQTIELAASSRKAITFTARKTDRSNVVGDYRVLLSAIDADGKSLSALIIRVECISSNKRFGITNGQFYNMYSNMAGLSYERFNSGFSDYDLFAAGKTNLDSAKKLLYSVNLDYYTQQNSIGLYNTFVDYQTRDWNVKAGNVYGDLDFAINGRGAIGTYNLGNNQSVSLYAVQNVYMLINGLGGSGVGAKTIAADYTSFQSPLDNFQVSLIKSDYSFFGLNQYQASAKFNQKIDDQQYFGLEGGLSAESYNHNTAKPAFSAGFTYHLNGEKYQLSSDLYYSSPYFTGLRRGLTQSLVRLTKKFDDQNSISAYVNIYQSNPSYQYGQQDTLLKNSRQNDLYTGGISYNLNYGHLNVSFGPYLMQQKLSANDSVLNKTGSPLWASSALRVAAIASYNTGGNNYSLQADYGHVYLDNTNKIPAPYNSLRIIANWTSRYLGFNAYIQMNPYYLTDDLSIISNTKYDEFSGGPSFHFTAFNNKLNFQGSFMYNHYSFSHSDNFSANSVAKLTLKDGWAITGSFISAQIKQYTVGGYQPAMPVSNTQFYTSQMRVGIEKQFGHAGNSADKKLELSYYFDVNGNGKRDDGEPAAQNVLVSLNDEVAETDGRGRVKFTDLKPGLYDLNIRNSNGWSMEDPVSINMKSSQKLNVPLIKTKAVKGNLVPDNEKYNQAVLILSGVKITATNAKGKIFETLTGDGGDFCFYLPPDSYTVSVTTNGLNFSVRDNILSVNTNNGNSNPLTFKCKDERRKVTIVTFD